MKRAQAALEFLMTYGWAILVVLAAIGALAYFGVLSPSRFLAEKCVLPSGIACLDSTASRSSMSFIIQNGFGFDLDNVQVSVNGTGCFAAAAGPTRLENDRQAMYVVTCSPPSGKFKGDLTVAYTNQDTGLSHVKSGELILQIP
jgi:hypothetical protein